MVFINLERILLKRTDAIVFESKYSFDVFSEKVGEPGCRAPVIHNGLMAEDFEPVTARDGAADFVFVGELRQLKGVDTLLKAFAAVRAKHPRARLLAVGGGPDEENFRRLAGELGIAGAVEFPGPRPAREAFAGGRVLVVPSRKESFPYIVLEAIAAGQPLIATNVGGIPEIFGPHAAELIAPGRPQELAAAMTGALEGGLDLAARTAALNERARGEFSAEVMAERIGSLYDSLLQHRRAAAGSELLEAEESSISA
jgi:glycosyltransferase involved in cell wall biosynthesis